MDNLREKIRQFPDAPGVYLMKDARGVVLYVGKARSLRDRVRSYFVGSLHDERAHVAAMMREVADVDYVEAASEVDALLMEARLIKNIQPRYNRELRDGKIYPFIEITWGDDFPGVYVTRKANNRRSRYFGPFTDVRGMRAAIQLLQPAFRFRTCSLAIRADDEKRRFARPCLLYYIQRCTAPCAALIGKDEYRDGIRLFVRFLEGKRTRVIATLEAQMQARAAAREYEEAARLRDQLRALRSLSARGDLSVFPEAALAPVADLQAGLRELQHHLGLPSVPRRIDGVDVANLGGAEAAGALVTFVDAKPFKYGYRRFRITGPNTRDDPAMIAEVVSRRFRRLREEDEPMPDILLVDGGAQQWAAARRAIVEQGLEPPVILSLAKREEEIYTDVHKPPLLLKRHSLALRLLQYIRDEAHRFAGHYHHILRQKALAGKGRGEAKRSTPTVPDAPGE